MVINYVALAFVHVSAFTTLELHTAMAMAGVFTFSGWLHSIHLDAVSLPACVCVLRELAIDTASAF